MVAATASVIVRVLRLPRRKVTSWGHRKCQRCLSESSAYQVLLFLADGGPLPSKVYVCDFCLRPAELAAFEGGTFLRVEAPDSAT